MSDAQLLGGRRGRQRSGQDDKRRLECLVNSLQEQLAAEQRRNKHLSAQLDAARAASRGQPVIALLGFSSELHVAVFRYLSLKDCASAARVYRSLRNAWLSKAGRRHMCLALSWRLDDRDVVTRSSRSLQDSWKARDGIAAILSAMKCDIASEATQFAACGALLRLCSTASSRNLERIVNDITFEQGPAIVRTALVTHMQSVRTVTHTCRLMAAMDYHGNGWEVLAAALVNAMDSHRDVEAVQVHATAALHGGGYDIARVRTLPSLGAIDAAMAGMRAHPQSPEVQAKGCDLLGHILLYRHQADAADIAAAGGIDLVIRAVRTHLDVADVCSAGCSALGELCHEERTYVPGRGLQEVPERIRSVLGTNRMAVGSAGGVELLIMVATAHSETFEVVDRVIRAMLYLSEDAAGSGAENVARMRGQAALEQLLRTLRRFAAETQNPFESDDNQPYEDWSLVSERVTTLIRGLYGYGPNNQFGLW